MSGVKDTDKGYKDIKAYLKALDGAELTVGIHEGFAGVGGNPKGSSETIATYAAANEFGTSNIPSRPWMRTAIDEKEGKHREALNRAAKRVLTKGVAPVMALFAVGNTVRNSLIKSIKSGDWEENAESTLDQKKSSKPLVDTGAMQRAITHKVEFKK